jgi:hypothetical protein
MGTAALPSGEQKAKNKQVCVDHRKADLDSFPQQQIRARRDLRSF